MSGFPLVLLLYERELSFQVVILGLAFAFRRVCLSTRYCGSLVVHAPLFYFFFFPYFLKLLVIVGLSLKSMR
jgi:hypothetical protein